MMAYTCRQPWCDVYTFDGATGVGVGVMMLSERLVGETLVGGVVSVCSRTLSADVNGGVVIWEGQW